MAFRLYASPGDIARQNAVMHKRMRKLWQFSGLLNDFLTIYSVRNSLLSQTTRLYNSHINRSYWQNHLRQWCKDGVPLQHLIHTIYNGLISDRISRYAPPAEPDSADCLLLAQPLSTTVAYFRQLAKVGKEEKSDSFLSFMEGWKNHQFRREDYFVQMIKWKPPSYCATLCWKNCTVVISILTKLNHWPD